VLLLFYLNPCYFTTSKHLSSNPFSANDHNQDFCSMASFRKRNVPLRSGASALSESPKSTKQELAQGVRPSPLDGRLTTSTGTRSLDGLLAGHAGFALGTSLLVEESGTTDFGGSLLRYYASEGVVQGHHIHVLGMNEGWGRDLPGVAEVSKSARKEGNSSGDGTHDRDTSRKSSDGGSGEKMKIAWRYERLGEFGSGPRGTSSSIKYCIQMAIAKTLIRDDLLISRGYRQKLIAIDRAIYLKLRRNILP